MLNQEISPKKNPNRAGPDRIFREGDSFVK